YKAHRAEEDGTEQTPPGLAVQIPLITQVLTAAGIATAEHDGYEADDVIATLATRAASGVSGHGLVPVDVVTGDRDLLQLADDAPADVPTDTGVPLPDVDRNRRDGAADAELLSQLVVAQGERSWLSRSRASVTPGD